MPQMGPWTVSAANAQRIVDALTPGMPPEDGETFADYMDRWMRETMKDRVHGFEQRAAATAVLPDDGVIDG